MHSTLTAAQRKAFAFAKAEGRVFAGFNHTREMARFKVAASTLRALERAKLVTCDTEVGTGLLFAVPMQPPTPTPEGVTLTEARTMTTRACPNFSAKLETAYDHRNEIQTLARRGSDLGARSRRQPVHAARRSTVNMNRLTPPPNCDDRDEKLDAAIERARRETYPKRYPGTHPLGYDWIEVRPGEFVQTPKPPP